MVLMGICLTLIILLIMSVGIMYALLFAELDSVMKAVCVPCWHQMSDDPPPDPPLNGNALAVRLRAERRHNERCSRCHGRTTSGLYVVRK